MVAFTAPKQTNFAATHVFEFDGTVPGGYSEMNVENTNPTHWKYVGEIGQELLCEGEDKACRIAVTDSYFDDSTFPNKLSGLTITASTSLAGKAVVSGITNPSQNLISNQDD